MIIKPPLNLPISTLFLWREIVFPALIKNKAPKGTLNLILGNSKVIFEEWINSPLVNDIIFFGESEQGINLGNKIYLAGKKPILELSGNDMMFIWKDGEVDKAVESLLDAFLASTQICMVPKKAFVHEDVFDEFLGKFIEKTKDIKVGLPSKNDTALVPVAKMNKFYEFLEDAIGKGANLEFGGERIDYNGNLDSEGVFIQPTILTVDNIEKAKEMRVVAEENFFPLIPVIKVTTSTGNTRSELLKDKEIFNKMIDIANKNAYGLRTSVWIKSDYFTRKFFKYLHNSGLVRINSRHVEFSLFLATHGGTGRTGGPFGEMNYVWEKTTHLQGVSRFD